MASFFEKCGKTVTEIRNKLVCHVCKGHARPGEKRWYRCLNLHHICQECKGKEEKCSCGQPISLEYCKIIEDLLSVEGLKFNCNNTKNGCKEALVENALEQHESECIYRLVPCPYDAMWEDGCGERIAFQKVIQHFEYEHLNESNEVLEVLPRIDLSKIQTGNLNELGLSGNDCYDDPYKCTLNNQTFLFGGKTTDKIVYQWVYILGSPDEAKNFSYTFKLIGRKSENSFKGKVASIDEDFDTLFESGKCFAIPHKALIAQFVDEDNNYEYSLEIQNLKEEVKDEHCESGISDNDEDTKE